MRGIPSGAQLLPVLWVHAVLPEGAARWRQCVSRPGTAFDEIRAIYDADEALRSALAQELARAEVLLRTHTAYVIANHHGPCGRYLEEDPQL